MSKFVITTFLAISLGGPVYAGFMDPDYGKPCTAPDGTVGTIDIKGYCIPLKGRKFHAQGYESFFDAQGTGIRKMQKQATKVCRRSGARKAIQISQIQRRLVPNHYPTGRIVSAIFVCK